MSARQSPQLQKLDHAKIGRRVFGKFVAALGCGLDAQTGARIMRRAEQRRDLNGAQQVSYALRIAAFMLAGCTLDQAAERAREPGVIILDEGNDHEMAKGEGPQD